MTILNRGTIESDLHYYGKILADKMWAIVDVMHIKGVDKGMFGYTITKLGVDYTVSMKYTKRSDGAIVIGDEKWTVIYQDTAIMGFTDLENVMDYILSLT